MSKLKIITEGAGEKSFLCPLLPGIKIKSLGSGSKIYLTETSDINMKYVKKEIGYALVDKFTHIVFVADLEKMNEDLLSSNIGTRKKELKSLYPSLNLDFFIEKKQLEAWLISDIDCLVSILGNHKYIPYKKITNPTDNINDPLGIISSLFRAKGMTYKKQLYESKIGKGFSPAKSINSSFKYFYTTIKSY